MTRTPATRRAVSDVLAHGLRGDLAHSAVGVELGQLLQSGITADMSDAARRGEIVEALREACGQDPVAYTRLVELVFVAGLDELELLVELPDSATSRGSAELPPAPPRRSARRRR